MRNREPSDDRLSLYDRVAFAEDAVGAAFFGSAGEWLVELSELASGMHVLEIGSGNGAVTLAAARAVAPLGTVSASDASRAMVAALEAKLRAESVANVGVFHVSDAQSLFERVYDAVLAGFVVFLLPDPQEALRDCLAALKPRGTLAFTTQGAPDPSWRWMSVLPLFEGAPLRTRPTMQADLFASPASIRSLLADLGVVDCNIHERTFPLEFASPDEWWAWTSSHGERALWERYSPVALERARAWAYRQLARIQSRSGRLVLRVHVRATVARVG